MVALSKSGNKAEFPKFVTETNVLTGGSTTIDLLKENWFWPRNDPKKVHFLVEKFMGVLFFLFFYFSLSYLSLFFFYSSQTISYKLNFLIEKRTNLICAVKQLSTFLKYVIVCFRIF